MPLYCDTPLPTFKDEDIEFVRKSPSKFRESVKQPYEKAEDKGIFESILEDPLEAIIWGSILF